MEIDIVTGYSNPGGSTVALINLVELFREKGHNATLWGPNPWHMKMTDFGDNIQNWRPTPDNVVISHYCLPSRKTGVPMKKHILACHETAVFPLLGKVQDELNKAGSNIFDFWDEMVFVSQSQADWQGVPGDVIPNVIHELKKKTCEHTNIAGVIGSIDPHKQTHVSIQRAKKAGYSQIEIFGDLTDYTYFRSQVQPLLGRDVRYLGFQDNKQAMYDMLQEVFHSSLGETFNYIKHECEMTGVKYNGLPSADPGSEYWPKDKIYDAWMEVINR